MKLENLKGLLVELEQDELFEIEGGAPLRWPPLPDAGGMLWGGGNTGGC